MPLTVTRYFTLSRLYTLANLLVLSLVIYCGVDIFYTLTGSTMTHVEIKREIKEQTKQLKTGARRRAFQHYQAAIDRGLFGHAEQTAKKPQDIDVDALEHAALKVALLGTVSGDEKTARAVILDKTNRGFQSLYKVGDTIQDAEILRILRGKVVLRVGDKNQVLTMEEKPASSPGASRTRRARRPGLSASRQARAGTTITLDSAVVNKSLENITQLLSQVRVRPHYQSGRADGLMLSQVRPNSIFTRLGLRNGDIIQTIDGEEIESPDDIMDFYEELKDGSSVSLGIKRRGQTKVLNYRFR